MLSCINYYSWYTMMLSSNADSFKHKDRIDGFNCSSKEHSIDEAKICITENWMPSFNNSHIGFVPTQLAIYQGYRLIY